MEKRTDHIYSAKNVPAVDVINKVSKFPSAALHEAYGKRGALISSIKPLDDIFSLTGPAVTVELQPGDNLMLHKAIYEAKKGDVLVVDAKGFTEAGVWGFVMSNAAIQRGIAGLVVFGSVRDKMEIINLGFPVFSAGVCIKGTTKIAPGFINKPICISDVIVGPGDVVRGDSDGVVVIKYNDIDAVISKAEKIVEKERKVLKKIKAGHSTLDIYKFDALTDYNFKK
jgi:4-hydroxy-4-methyl-2-oxoglutarate aldolase